MSWGRAARGTPHKEGQEGSAFLSRGSPPHGVDSVLFQAKKPRQVQLMGDGLPASRGSAPDRTTPVGRRVICGRSRGASEELQ